METSVITQGLTISVLGLLITFSALGVFILIMVVLKKLFPYKEEAKTGDSNEENAETSATVSMAKVEEGDDDPAVVAAIAVAISHLLSRSQSKLGNNLEAGRGSWWMVNRMAARQAANLLKK
ncbi:MAG: OadG family protein [Anaerolineaceae bacterium]